MDLARDVAHAILSGASDAVIATDREGTIRLWNAGAERIFGHRVGDALGRSLDLIIPERLRQAHWDGWTRVLETGESRYDEGDLLSVPAIRADGAQISVEFTILPLKDEQGRMTGMAALMRDVTKRFAEVRALRKQLAEAQRAAKPA